MQTIQALGHINFEKKIKLYHKLVYGTTKTPLTGPKGMIGTIFANVNYTMAQNDPSERGEGEGGGGRTI